MAKKTTIEKLTADIQKVLQEYGEEVNLQTEEAVKAVTKKGVKAVKSAAKSTFGGEGDYAKGWTSQVETGRFSAQGVIYNKDVPGLPHLLENGHAKRGGGRVPGRVHIAPVEEKLVETFQKDLEEKL